MIINHLNLFEVIHVINVLCMVLALSSQYLQLKLCKAFDASLLSGYPEENNTLYINGYKIMFCAFFVILSQCSPAYTLAQIKFFAGFQLTTSHVKTSGHQCRSSCNWSGFIK